MWSQLEQKITHNLHSQKKEFLLTIRENFLTNQVHNLFKTYLKSDIYHNKARYSIAQQLVCCIQLTAILAIKIIN
ncbi:hypothetical protein BpHYR1_036600 [Brachionus plicatilis]|uniref:Uncharacterized protein n=1 Tax=Brachionus plicatilis TaxID=10195 RepID=A0A3M7T3M9_BRAPC|nr:hypothetical protein BpHYR1_036600 [Brachionus plicatilis]